MKLYRLNRNLELVDSGDCDLPRALQVLHECYDRGLKKYAAGEEAISETSFGLQASEQDFIEITCDGLDSAATPPSTAAGSADAVERHSNKKRVRELTEVVWNRRGLDRIPEFYAPDFVADYRPYVPLREGHAGIRGMVEGAWTAFPDYHEELNELIAEGDRVVVHLTISGTQQGQWGPLRPTGKRLQFEEIVILQIRDGKVLRQRGIPDNLNALRQLGVVPTPR